MICPNKHHKLSDLIQQNILFSLTSQSNESIPNHQPYKNHNKIKDKFEVV